MRFGFAIHKGDTNHHGTQKPWNEKTVRGPKLKWIKMDRKSPGIYKRVIFYFADGSCRCFDFYSKQKSA